MMAFRRRDNIGQTFRKNTHLKQFILTDVTPTGRILGTGSYGSVEEVVYKHLTCAAKKLHETLIEAGNDGVSQVVAKYEQECQLMSSLRHPNITQFLGLCFLPDTKLPLLVMEQLDTSFDDLLEHMPGLPLSLKSSILGDVASGLVYLHEKDPPVIHRDLTAKNVLLTSSLLAKITDMGNSRIVDMKPGEMARTLSQLPGTLVYMPPEALDDTRQYGASLDVFSFGHLSLFTLTQVFPGNLMSSTYPDPENPRCILGRSEVERRGEYFKLLELDHSCCYPDLITLIKQCLNNIPDHRPATEVVLTRLCRIRTEVEGEYGACMSKLDIAKIRLLKEMKFKDKKIKELTQQEERHQTELEEVTRELEVRDRHFQKLQVQIQEKNVLIASKNRYITAKDEEVRRLKRELEAKNNLLQKKEEMCEDLQIQLNKQLLSGETEVSMQQKELGIRSEKHERDRQMPLSVPLELQWKCGQDMPIEMGGYMQTALVQGTVYIAGLDNESESSHTIMGYNTSSGEWKTLPPYRMEDFAIVVVDNQLVLVGGYYVEENIRRRSRILGAWSDDSKEWTHPYPEMPTGRSECTAIVYKDWLVVTGGWGDGFRIMLSAVEVMNIGNKQWYTGSPTPVPWCAMKTAVVGDVCYFMGGNTGYFTHTVHSASLPALVSQIHRRNFIVRNKPIWKEMGLDIIFSSPLSVGGSLLALGGMKKGKTLTDIYLYEPDTGKWVKAGDLPSPRHSCTCIVLNNGRDLLVAGGKNEDNKVLKRLDIASY